MTVVCMALYYSSSNPVRAFPSPTSIMTLCATFSSSPRWIRGPNLELLVSTKWYVILATWEVSVIGEVLHGCKIPFVWGGKGSMQCDNDAVWWEYVVRNTFDRMAKARRIGCPKHARSEMGYHSRSHVGQYGRQRVYSLKIPAVPYMRHKRTNGTTRRRQRLVCDFGDRDWMSNVVPDSCFLIDNGCTDNDK